MKVLKNVQFCKSKISQFVRMAVNSNPILRSFMNFGQFDYFNPQSFLTRNRIFINRLIKILLFFNALKQVVIVCAAWFGHPELKLYLMEMFLFDESQQKNFDIGIAVIQIGFCFGFHHWTSLNEKISTLDSFSFLLIPNTNDLYRFQQQCHLDKQSTDRFTRVYRIVGLFLKLVLGVYYLFFLGTIPLCLYHSFRAVSFTYFVSACLTLTVITLIFYLLLASYLPSKYAIAIISTEFLILRLRAIDSLIHKRFVQTNSVSKPEKLKNQKADRLEALYLLNDFCEQFKEINRVLDSSLSFVLLGLFTTLFVIP